MFLKEISKEWLCNTTYGFELYLKLFRRASGPHGYPDTNWQNGVLKSNAEVDHAVQQVRELGLPVVDDRPKNWDSLAALDVILSNTTKDAVIFDAGGERYSEIMPWLYLYGYRNLFVGNIAFKKSFNRGVIKYEIVDITGTPFSSSKFDAITCLSVIEHSVDIEAFFREVDRILKPGGHIIISTDYSDKPIDTSGHTAYGGPIKIFVQEEIESMFRIAEKYSLHLSSDFSFSDIVETPVHWKGFFLQFPGIYTSQVLKKIRALMCQTSMIRQSQPRLHSRLQGLTEHASSKCSSHRFLPLECRCHTNSSLFNFFSDAL